MANLIDIIINASWRGGGATSQAQRELRNLGTTASSSTIELAAMQARSGLLQQEMGRLATEVAKGSLTVGEARTRYNQFAGSLATFDTRAKATGLTAAQLVKGITAVTVVAGAAAVAARQLWNALEEGAGLELTAQRFDRLAVSIGTTGDALRTDLQSATSGMLSNAQAMALATNLIGLDLVNTHDETVRWSRAITELNMDIGELVLALSNQTTRRFDQLNVSVAGFDEKLQALKGTMSDEQAFAMAFLEQAEAQIEKVGGASETTRGDLLRLQADWRSLDEDFKLWLAGLAGPTLGFASGRQGTAIRETIAGMATEAQSVEDLAEAYKTLQAVQEALANMSLLDRAAFVASGGMAELEAAEEAIVRGLFRVSDNAEEFQRNLQAVFGDKAIIEGLNLQIASLGEVEQAYGELTDGVQLSAAAREESRRTIEAETEAVRVLEMELGRLIAGNLRLVAASDAIIDASQGKVAAYLREAEALRSLSDISEQIGARKLDGLELTADRADLWIDFQEDLTSISESEEQRRLDLTASYEQQRTDLVASYEQQRLQEQRDWERQRARAAQQLEADIAGVHADTNERIEDLTRDHAQRIQDIIEDADFNIGEAASRLDARAVAQIQRQRDKALEDERQGYDQRVQEAREAEQQRINDLRAAHAERQRIEEEDRAYRLQQMAESHQEQLAELEAQHGRRLRQITEQAEKERRERERQYQKDYYQLGGYWSTRQQIETTWQRQAITAMENYWRSHIAIINGSSIGGVPGGSGGGTSGTAMNAEQLGQLAVQQMQAAGWSAQAISRQLTIMSSSGWRAEDIARWLEEIFGLDIPGYLMGIDRVPRTGLALLHEGERVIPAAAAARERAGRGSVGDVTININGARSPQDTAREVRREMTRILREATA